MRCIALVSTLLACACASTPQPLPSVAANGEREDTTAQIETLRRARSFLDQRRTNEALALIEQVTHEFEARYEEPTAGKTRGERVYCARSASESLWYLGQAAARNEASIVVSRTWVDAYYMRGYAMLELNRLDAARGSLEQAQRLSPANSQVVAELAYTYQVEKNWKRALELFAEAEEDAALSPPSEADEERRRALRGEGYALVELGRLDEAEAKYRECLELNPADDRAKRELEYVASLRSKLAH